MRLKNKPTLHTSRQQASLAVALLGLLVASPVMAAEWSDTSLSWRYGTDFAEPYDNNADGSHKDIRKNIVALTHVSGFAYGTNFFNVDFLMSDKNDPGQNTSQGAQEVYAVYRNTLDFSKIFNKNLQTGPIKSYGWVTGFDFNSKNDSYGSKKRMLVIGPNLMMDVPGFLNISVQELFESNAPNGITKRYEYKPHPALEADWGIPIGKTPLSFEGYGLLIASKGKSEFGQATAPETHIDAKVMYDLSTDLHLSPKTFRIGGEYEYWHNKFGNPVSQAGKGANASTPMIRLEYHF